MGHWPLEGYPFKASAAIEGDHFLGLALDQINQPGLTPERLDSGLEQLKASIP